ncbi:uncharacterized protein [Spinacia oleracea]|uniref:Uncharacterized protein isoform X2 n=1 Tax=Spinacia oleracea TaxID=3562 RepID=A0ABM3RG52_SPIOL|nr:uncharacterized protein LOC110799140 isoform X2 [Spinacia oleracea]
MSTPRDNKRRKTDTQDHDIMPEPGDEGSRGDEHTAIARTEVDDKVYVPDEQEAPSDKVPETTISKSTIRVCSSSTTSRVPETTISRKNIRVCSGSTTSGDKLVADAGDPLDGGNMSTTCPWALPSITVANPKPLPKPCPASTRIQVGDFTVFLVPRVKLDFHLFCEEDKMVTRQMTREIVTSLFSSPRIFKKSISVPYEDVRVRLLFNQKMKGKLTMLADGRFFFRPPNLQNTSVLLKLGNELFEKLGTFEVTDNGTLFVVKVFPPSFSEDATQMKCAISGLTEDPPAIILNGIPSHWFAEQPDSSKPSKRLLCIFLETFGKIRDLDVVPDENFGKDERNFYSTKKEDSISTVVYCKVIVHYKEYEHCYNALKFLCSHSLQKGSGIADYEVSWKEEDLCPRFLSLQKEDPRMKFVWKDKRDVSADHEKVDFEEFQALKHKMIMLEEELEDVMARLEKFEALKSNGALP